ncbi:hypothetical protein RND81_06G114400 [Saponaria officinalis]|uniref:Alpha 1,4-glycosyltransferase domain-containing protein n=1 Tax=Saponaria officinalis TaxID=3572 RepID=A0AAW1KAT5_SAPOF
MENSTINNPIKDDFSKQYHSNNYSSYNHHKFSKKSLIYSCFCLPITSFLALFILVLLAYNSFTIFFYFIPSFSMENAKQNDGKKFQNSPFSSSTPIYAMKEESPRKTHHKFNPSSTYFTHTKGPKTRKSISTFRRSPPSPRLLFSKQVKEFFVENSCKTRVFMTWISSLNSFGNRERFCIESLFKFNPNACLLIVSNSMDTQRGAKILRPFLRMNFKIKAISPDFRFVFKNTSGAQWYNELEKGNVKKGGISLGQNLSNLLRLALLYKYGGIYMDIDFIVLKRLNKLRNSIGAQMVDQKTKKWSRLNNAFLIFDKKHPLLSRFIEEFALTFNGNKWGYNGPYLVSRVVERLNGTMGLLEGPMNITILPPRAFYVVDWVRIGSLFEKPKDELHLQWINDKIKQIEEESYGVHLWNRQSRRIRVEDGSIISHLVKRSCVFCNSSISTL